MSNTTDYVRIAIVSALVIVVGLAVFPLMQFVPFPLFKVVWIGPLYSMAGWILLQRSSLPGTIVFFGGLLGVILTVFMPYMFFVSLSGGIGAQLAGKAAELLGAERYRSHGIRAVAFPIFQLPLMYVLVMPLDSTAAWVIMVALTTAVAATSWAGLYFGRLLERRMAPGVENNEA